MFITKNIDLKNITDTTNLSVNEFAAILNVIIPDLLSVHGKRKRVLPLNVIFDNLNIELTFNRTDSPAFILKSILFNIAQKYRKFRHNNIYIEDNFMLMLKRFSGFLYDNGTLTFVFTPVDKERLSEFLSELAPYVEQNKRIREHINSLPALDEPFYRLPNVLSGELTINNYVNILLKYSDLIYLDRFRYIALYFSDGAYSSKDIQFDKNNIKMLLSDLVNNHIKYPSDIIGIFPNKIYNLNSDNYENIDYLSFEFNYTDHTISVQKYLNNVYSEGISAYYADKRSGGYTGD